MCEEAIDFVITWVDGKDPLWLKERNKYSCGKFDDVRDIRYRDWGFLKYWFRSIEKNAPWVRKIFFVTWGHIPEWMDKNNSKLCIVRHEDFIPKEFLPVFNSNAIAVNLFRIKDLSEKFVFFNDDMFLNKKIDSRYFFEKGLPRYCFEFNPIYTGKRSIGNIVCNDIGLINDHFRFKTTVKKNFFKIFNIKNGLRTAFRNLLFYQILLYNNYFSGFIIDHNAHPFLKSTFMDVWSKEKDRMVSTSESKFRSEHDVNHWLFVCWHLVSGRFIPKSLKDSIFYRLEDENCQCIVDEIINQRHGLICLNDTPYVGDFEKMRKKVEKAFEKVYPQKSTYEK